MTTETLTRTDAYIARKQVRINTYVARKKVRIDTYVARKQVRIDAHLASTGACIDAWRANRDRRLPVHGMGATLVLDEAPSAVARPCPRHSARCAGHRFRTTRGSARAAGTLVQGPARWLPPPTSHTGLHVTGMPGHRSRRGRPVSGRSRRPSRSTRTVSSARPWEPPNSSSPFGRSKRSRHPPGRRRETSSGSVRPGKCMT